MSSDNTKDKKPDLPHPPTNVGKQNCRSSRHQHQNRWNYPGGGGVIHQEMLAKQGTHNAAMFHPSLKQIADYIQLNYGNEVSEVIRTMTPVIIDIPEVPRD
jgi:hypothetical protein